VDAVDHLLEVVGVFRTTERIVRIVPGLVMCSRSTACIGENSPEIRRRICAVCEWLGIEIDAGHPWRKRVTSVAS
jgi:hypothetical protein